ncbi:MAG TPA: flagellar hook-length control protein FliK, partial [Cryobacterium sp.]|nr:flagellar hook-length control protein FliK [Cryobacterium sp.]
FSLSGAQPGQHVLTISITPDNLGPVTVQAHVTGENIRVELFAPTDLARDALRAILPDLRRDLAGSGMNATLDLSSQNQTADPGAARQGRAQPDPRAEPGREAAALPERATLTPSYGTSSTIDVLA